VTGNGGNAGQRAFYAVVRSSTHCSLVRPTNHPIFFVLSLDRSLVCHRCFRMLQYYDILMNPEFGRRSFSSNDGKVYCTQGALQSRRLRNVSGNDLARPVIHTTHAVYICMIRQSLVLQQVMGHRTCEKVPNIFGVSAMYGSIGISRSVHAKYPKTLKHTASTMFTPPSLHAR